jgi:hypothetical protein
MINSAALEYSGVAITRRKLNITPAVEHGGKSIAEKISMVNSDQPDL